MMKSEGGSRTDWDFKPATTLGDVVCRIEDIRTGRPVHEYDLHFLNERKLVEIITKEEINEYNSWKNEKDSIYGILESEFYLMSSELAESLREVGIKELGIHSLMQGLGAKPDMQWEYEMECLCEEHLNIAPPENLGNAIQIMTDVINARSIHSLARLTMVDIFEHILTRVPQLIDGNDAYRGLYSMFTHSSNTLPIYRGFLSSAAIQHRSVRYQALQEKINGYQWGLAQAKCSVRLRQGMKQEISRYYELNDYITQFDLRARGYRNMNGMKVMLAPKGEKYIDCPAGKFIDWQFDRFENYRKFYRAVKRNSELRKSRLFAED